VHHAAPKGSEVRLKISQHGLSSNWRSTAQKAFATAFAHLAFHSKGRGTPVFSAALCGATAETIRTASAGAEFPANGAS
jgi:hypothetical protein